MINLFVEGIDEIRIVASTLVKTWGNRFDVDELVNAAYIGYNRAITNNPKLVNTQFNKINILLYRAKMDMMDYISKETDERKTGSLRISYVSFQADDEYRKQFNAPYEEAGFERIEASDMLDCIFDKVRLTNDEWTIIQSYFEEENLLKEVADEIGLSESGTSQKKTRMLKRLNEAAEEMLV